MLFVMADQTMLPKPCRVCGKPGKAICDQCSNVQRARYETSRPPKTNVYRHGEYQTNRRIIIDRAWALDQPCVICGHTFVRKEDITVEHIIPLRKGGTSALSNLGPAHAWCNYGWNRKNAE